MPVFFIRDGMKFPDMVHALKPNPRNHIQGAFTLLPVPTILPAQLPLNVSVLRYRPIMSMPMQQCLCSCKSIIQLQANTEWRRAEWWRIWDFFSYVPESCHVRSLLSSTR